MTEADASFVGKVLQDIADKESSSQEEAVVAAERRAKGIELHNSLKDIAVSYGDPEGITVEAGARLKGAMTHRPGQTTRQVAPEMEIETESGRVSMQVLEIQPMHVDDNRHQALGYVILMNGEQLVSAKPSGEVINWLNEEASSEQINMIRNEAIPVIEEAYAEKFPEKSKFHNPTNIEIVDIFNGTPDKGGRDGKTAVPKRKPRGGYRRMGPKANGIDRENSATIQPD